MRYPKPSAGEVQRQVVKIVTADGDTFLFVMGTMVTGTFYVTPAIILGGWFFLLLLLTLIPLWMVSTYIRSTTPVRWSSNHFVEQAEHSMRAIRGSGVESYALPIFTKIFEHAPEHQSPDPFGDRRKDCDLCGSRLAALRALRPDDRNPADTADLQQVMELLEIRKELNG